MKVEKALIELNEIKNDLVFQKNDELKSEPAYDIRTAGNITSTSFNNVNNSRGNVVMTPLVLPRNPSGAFRDTFSGGFFKEGSILGNIDTMTNDQLKERLLVAETLMKKLYNRSKDIELYHK